jgi:hypothetical protein
VHADAVAERLNNASYDKCGQWRQSCLKTGGSWVPAPPFSCVKDLKPRPPRPPALQNLGVTTPQPPGLTPMSDDDNTAFGGVYLLYSIVYALLYTVYTVYSNRVRR